jgi:predicted AlkP superfamily pyrophosphatase or phosphodiesterase
LREAGVDVHAFLHYTISGSGLSQMHYPEVSVHTFSGVPDLWVGVRHLAEQPLEKPRLIWTYYGGVDGTSHRYGPDSDQAEAEFRAFIDVLLKEFIERLSVETRRRTVFILLADHGQLLTKKDPHYELKNHPDLIERLHILPTGENRLAYLYPRPGQVDAVEEYIQRTWPGGFTCAPSSDLLKKRALRSWETSRNDSEPSWRPFAHQS